LLKVEGKIAVSGFKEPAAILGQAKEIGQMLKNIQSLLHLVKRQKGSDLADLFLPPFSPVLKTLIGKLRTADSLPGFSITLPPVDLPENHLDYFHSFSYALAEEGRQEAKGL
jgi:hypothetical protein